MAIVSNSGSSPCLTATMGIAEGAALLVTIAGIFAITAHYFPHSAIGLFANIPFAAGTAMTAGGGVFALYNLVVLVMRYRSVPSQSMPAKEKETNSVAITVDQETKRSTPAGHTFSQPTAPSPQPQPTPAPLPTPTPKLQPVPAQPPAPSPQPQLQPELVFGNPPHMGNSSSTNFKHISEKGPTNSHSVHDE